MEGGEGMRDSTGTVGLGVKMHPEGVSVSLGRVQGGITAREQAGQAGLG